MKIYNNAAFITCEEDSSVYNCMVEHKGFIKWIGNEEDLPPSVR